MAGGLESAGKAGRAGRALRWAAAALAAATLAALPLASQRVVAAEEEEHEEGGVPHYPLEKPDRLPWSFAGPFGTFDAAQLQRGLQVYRDVCSACHGLSMIAFRTLADETGPHLSDEAMRAVAAAYQVRDADTGEMRAGRPADYFPASRPFGTITPPDLSLMAKARWVSDGFPSWLIDGFRFYQEGGPNYIHAFLTGYRPAPEGTTVTPGTFYNPNFVAGAATAMPPILRDGMVNYADGTPETLDQYAKDVAAFLMWTAEPKLVDRKRIGFMALIFLAVLAVLLYLTKRQVWAGVKH